MPISQQRFEVALDAYDELLSELNNLRRAISDILYAIDPPELHKNPSIAFIASLVSVPPQRPHPDVALERKWFARVGEQNKKQREKMQRRRDRATLGPSAAPRPSGLHREIPGQYAHQTIFADPNAPIDDEEGGVDL